MDLCRIGGALSDGAHLAPTNVRFWHKADVTMALGDVSVSDPKRTWQLIFTALHNSLDTTD
jgi:hypothetical protein